MYTSNQYHGSSTPHTIPFSAAYDDVFDPLMMPQGFWDMNTYLTTDIQPYDKLSPQLIASPDEVSLVPDAYLPISNPSEEQCPCSWPGICDNKCACWGDVATQPIESSKLGRLVTPIRRNRTREGVGTSRATSGLPAARVSTNKHTSDSRNFNGRVTKPSQHPRASPAKSHTSTFKSYTYPDAAAATMVPLRAGVQNKQAMQTENEDEKQSSPSPSECTRRETGREAFAQVRQRLYTMQYDLAANVAQQMAAVEESFIIVHLTDNPVVDIM